MRIVFDHGTPAPLRFVLDGHEVSTAFELGWSTFDNRALLAAAEDEFDLMITTDGNPKYQQNLPRRDLAILVLPTTSWPRRQRHAGEIPGAVATMRPGEYLELTW